MKALRIIFYILGFVLLIIAGSVIYVKNFLPNIAVSDIKVEITPERIERGKYLANHVMVCMDCHSTRDWSYFSGPITPGTFGAGGDEFTPEMGFPGTFYAPNITPFNLREWSDGEMHRAITAGVSKDGSPLFPVMPYHSYGKADPDDIYSVIAYIRTLEPIETIVPASKPDFPMSIIMHLIPQKPEHSKIPSKSNMVAHGGYLANVAACADCHTPLEKGRPVNDLAMAGGREFDLPFGTLRAPNITPHNETGIGFWTEDNWIERFRSYDSIYKLQRTNGLHEFNSLMPWNMYGSMNKDDLRALYAYFRSLKPIENRVERVTLR